MISVRNKRDNETKVKEIKYKAYCLKITRKFSPVTSTRREKKESKRTLMCVTSDKRARELRPLTRLLRNFAEREKRVTRTKNLWLDEARGCPDAAAALVERECTVSVGKRVLIPK